MALNPNAGAFTPSWVTSQPAAVAPPDEMPVPKPAAAEEEDSAHSRTSLLDLMYRPLHARVVWILLHESRCCLAAVDHLRLSWACESGALRRVLCYDGQELREASDGGQYNHNEFAQYFGADADWYWQQAARVPAEVDLI